MKSLTVHTNYGDHRFKVETGEIHEIYHDEIFSLYWRYEEVPEEGAEPVAVETELMTFHSWRSVTYPDAEGVVTVELPEIPEPKPVGYGTVFIAFGDDQEEWLLKGYVLLHKDHAGVVGPDKVKGTILTLITKPTENGGED